MVTILSNTLLLPRGIEVFCARKITVTAREVLRLTPDWQCTSELLRNALLYLLFILWSVAFLFSVFPLSRFQL